MVVAVSVVCGVLVALALLVLRLYWPARGQHEAHYATDLDVLPPTPAPEPVAAALVPPRAIGDVAPVVTLVRAPLSAAQERCNRMVDHAVMLSWNSHDTLQRNYDIMAFSAVACAFYRHGVTYA